MHRVHSLISLKIGSVPTKMTNTLIYLKKRTGGEIMGVLNELG